MSKSRTNVKVTKTTRNSLGQFARRLGRLVFISKAVIQNPKWEEGQATKNIPQFIVAPWKGRSFKKSEQGLSLAAA